MATDRSDIELRKRSASPRALRSLQGTIARYWSRTVNHALNREVTGAASLLLATGWPLGGMSRRLRFE